MENTMDMPAIYELDGNGESTGIVHTYCSFLCRNSAIASTLVSFDGSKTEPGMSPVVQDAHCEWCDKPL